MSAIFRSEDGMDYDPTNNDYSMVAAEVDTDKPTVALIEESKKGAKPKFSQSPT